MGEVLINLDEKVYYQDFNPYAGDQMARSSTLHRRAFVVSTTAVTIYREWQDDDGLWVKSTDSPLIIPLRVLQAMIQVGIFTGIGEEKCNTNQNL